MGGLDTDDPYEVRDPLLLRMPGPSRSGIPNLHPGSLLLLSFLHAAGGAGAESAPSPPPPLAVPPCPALPLPCPGGPGFVAL